MLYETIIKENAFLIEAVELTQEEFMAAITEGKRKKYFKLKHGHLWNVPTAEVSKSKQTDIALPTTML